MNSPQFFSEFINDSKVRGAFLGAAILLFLMALELVSLPSKSNAQGSTIGGLWAVAHRCDTSDTIVVVATSQLQVYALMSWPLQYDPFSQMGKYVRITNVVLVEGAYGKICTKEFGSIAPFRIQSVSDIEPSSINKLTQIVFDSTWKKVDIDLQAVSLGSGFNPQGLKMCGSTKVNFDYLWASVEPTGVQNGHYYHFHNIKVNEGCAAGMKSCPPALFENDTSFYEIPSCPTPTKSPISVATNTSIATLSGTLIPRIGSNQTATLLPLTAVSSIATPFPVPSSTPAISNRPEPSRGVTDILVDKELKNIPAFNFAKDGYDLFHSGEYWEKREKALEDRETAIAKFGRNSDEYRAAERQYWETALFEVPVIGSKIELIAWLIVHAGQPPR